MHARTLSILARNPTVQFIDLCIAWGCQLNCLQPDFEPSMVSDRDELAPLYERCITNGFETGSAFEVPLIVEMIVN